MHSLDNTLYFGKNLIYLDNIDSTNEYARQLIANSKPADGTAIIAHNQHKGKGQYGKTWESKAGDNLTFSLIVSPKFLPLKRVFWLNIAISLGINDWLLNSLQIQSSIKWPNDIYVDNKKLGGILIENVILKDRISHAVVGVGLNINQTEFSSNLPNPVSVQQLTGKSSNLEQMLRDVVKSVEVRYLQLKEGDYGHIKEEYEKHLYLKGKINSFKYSNKSFSGKILGIDIEGCLLIKNKDEILKFRNAEVEYLADSST